MSVIKTVKKHQRNFRLSDKDYTQLETISNTLNKTKTEVLELYINTDKYPQIVTKAHELINSDFVRSRDRAMARKLIGKLLNIDPDFFKL